MPKIFWNKKFLNKYLLFLKEKEKLMFIVTPSNNSYILQVENLCLAFSFNLFTKHFYYIKIIFSVIFLGWFEFKCRVAFCKKQNTKTNNNYNHKKT